MLRSTKNAKLSILFGTLVLSLTSVFMFSDLDTPTAAGSEFASFESCVYDRTTGRPIEGALVTVQALGSANANGTYTGPDGCVSPDNAFNVELFPGDYIQAEYALRGRIYTQQFRIPNRLLPQVYRRDFFLELPHGGHGPRLRL
jgi:hypothetical protein